jgi:hypothetical protein
MNIKIPAQAKLERGTLRREGALEWPASLRLQLEVPRLARDPFDEHRISAHGLIRRVAPQFRQRAPMPAKRLNLTTKKFVLTAEDIEQQRRSFAYGNTVIENPRITREMVDRAADELGKAQSSSQSR